MLKRVDIKDYIRESDETLDQRADGNYRYFAVSDKTYPLYRLYIRDNVKDGIDRDHDIFVISCLVKNSPKSWWHTADYPKDLAKDLIEMINQTVSR